MTDRFSHITSNPARLATEGQAEVSQRETSLTGKPKQRIVGREVFDSLMGLLAEVPETPTTPLGVFVANSTKRELRKQMMEIIQP
ncbi:hypothetical protein VPHD530_0043 [Vibrio phage D530]